MGKRKLEGKEATTTKGINHLKCRRRKKGNERKRKSRRGYLKQKT
jgi:hypothetical protein